MNYDNTSKTGMSSIVETVSNASKEERAIEKSTSNEMFKTSIMSFMDREMGNLDNLELAQIKVNEKLLDQMDEDAMDVNQTMRFSEMLAKQKTSRIHAIFDILKPTKDSANPLLNNEKEETPTDSMNLSTNELQVFLKLAQEMAKDKDND